VGGVGGMQGRANPTATANGQRVRQNAATWIGEKKGSDGWDVKRGAATDCWA
jgi:hypothetical protein